MQGGRAAHAGQRAIDGLDAVAPSGFGARLQPRLVELHDVGTGREEIVDLLVDGLGVGEREALLVAIVLVDRLLRHRERARQRDLDRLARVRAQELDVANLDRPAALDRPGDDRHGDLVAGAPDDLTDARRVDAIERVREFVRIAFAANLAVRDDVDAGALLVADRVERRLVLRLLEALRRHAPNFVHADARRHHLREARAVDEPVGLRVAPDD